MPQIENHTEHPFEFPEAPKMVDGRFMASNKDDSVMIPPSRPNTTADGKEIKVLGSATVTNEKLAEMRKHPVARHWFGPTSLTVVDDRSEGKTKAA